MVYLASLGIGPGDAKIIMEYTELEYFVEEVQRIRHNEDILEQMKLGDAVRMAFHGDVESYSNWRNNLQDEFQERTVAVEGETLFDIIKRSSKQRSQTLFDNIKQVTRG